jgi:DNA polymerase-3 subunit alpha
VSFVHLRVRSPYSLLRGAMRIPQLLERCRKDDMPAVAIADYDNMFGSLEFSQSAMKSGIQPIIATTVSVKPWKDEQALQHKTQTDELLLIAKNETGYENLMALSSKAYTNPADGIAPVVTYEDCFAHADGVIALTAGKFGGIGRALNGGQKDRAAELCSALKQAYGDRLYIELMRHGFEDERRIEPGLVELAVQQNIPLVATNHVFFENKEMYEAHDALLCVAEGRYVSEVERPRLNDAHYLKTPAEMKALFSDLPEAVANTMVIAQRCAVMSPARAPILPSFHDTDEQGNVLNETEALTKHAQDGLEARLRAHVYTEDMDEAKRGEIAAPYRDRLAYELDVIITMKFPGYFLIVSDFITWAKQQGIPVGPGRGSGAGSVVAWSLLITDLDPLRYGLIFERFLNPERVSMPDFDIDFCQERRDEVIRYVQKRYGYEQVAQIITFGKLQARAVLRDVGRVLQMPYGQVDRICKLVPANPANPVTLEEALDLEPELRRQMRAEESVEQLIKIALKLEGLYRHASTHAAGVVIADRRLDELVPVYRDPKSDMPVTQYSMKYAEMAGLVKFDFLGLKTLTVLQQTVNFLRDRGIEVDLSQLPEGDPKTYELLSAGDTIGVFQFESAGMQDALRKLKPDCFEDLIALGALYRPGPMDNIPTYIECKHGRKDPDYLHPMLTDVLRETHGVIIYQEQVQKIAQIMGGYTLGGADLLRRAMGKKIKEEMDSHRDIFTKGAKEKGVSEKQSSGIFDLVAKFAGYGFNKSHAAAYALIAYQTAYLKANYPVEFIAASMNYEMHTTDKLSIFRQEAQKMGIEVLPPDINKSKAYFAVEDGSIRYALAAVKNVGEQAMDAIVKEREAGGAFAGLGDFVRRVDAGNMNRRQLEHLIAAGAFDSLNDNRRQLYESSDILLAENNNATREKESNQNSLFGAVEAQEPREIPLRPTQDWFAIERLQKECDAIGFYLSDHPLSAYSSLLEQSGISPLGQIADRLGFQYGPVSFAGIVTGKKIKVSPKGKYAFVQLSDVSGWAECSVFDEELLARSQDLLENGTMVMVRGEGKRDEGGMRLIAKSLESLEQWTQNRRQSVLKLQLKGAAQLEELKALLGEVRPNASSLELMVEAGGFNVKLKVPQRYGIDPHMLSQIRMLDMVKDAELT